MVFNFYSTDATNSLKTSVSNGKSAVASAITDKGISTSATATFDTMASNIRAISSPISTKTWINICKVVENRTSEGGGSVAVYKSGWNFTLPSNFSAAVVKTFSTTVKSNDYDATQEMLGSSSYTTMGQKVFNFIENFDPNYNLYTIDSYGYWICIKRIGSSYRTLSLPAFAANKSSQRYRIAVSDLSSDSSVLRYSISGSNVIFTFTSTSWSGATGGANYYSLPIQYCL